MLKTPRRTPPESQRRNFWCNTIFLKLALNDFSSRLYIFCQTKQLNIYWSFFAAAYMRRSLIMAFDCIFDSFEWKNLRNQQFVSRGVNCWLLVPCGSLWLNAVNRGKSNWLYNDLIYIFCSILWFPNPKD